MPRNSAIVVASVLDGVRARTPGPKTARPVRLGNRTGLKSDLPRWPAKDALVQRERRTWVGTEGSTHNLHVDSRALTSAPPEAAFPIWRGNFSRWYYVGGITQPCIHQLRLFDYTRRTFHFGEIKLKKRVGSVGPSSDCEPTDHR